MLFKGTVLVCGAMVLAMSIPAGAEDRNVISVTASGSAVVKAEVATFEAWITSLSDHATEAVEATALDYARLVEALNDAGVPTEDIGSTKYALGPKWDFDKKGNKRKFLGFEARHGVTVHVREMSKLGGALDATAGAGITEIGRLNFKPQDPDSAQHAALADAVREAKKRAHTMAAAAGGSLGELIELTSKGAVLATGGRLYDSIALKTGVVTMLSPREQVVQVTVLARWRFIDGQ